VYTAGRGKADTQPKIPGRPFPEAPGKKERKNIKERAKSQENHKVRGGTDMIGSRSPLIKSIT